MYARATAYLDAVNAELPRAPRVPDPWTAGTRVEEDAPALLVPG